MSPVRGYAYRRAQFILAGREAIPLPDPKAEQPSPENVQRAEYIGCSGAAIEESGQAGLPVLHHLVAGYARVAIACAVGVQRHRHSACVFIGAYLITPYDLVWHVHTSWERIVRQLMPLVALLGMLSALPETTTA